MGYGLERDAWSADSYNPMHDYRNVDVGAWSEQWWAGLAQLDPTDDKYHAIARFVAAQLGLHSEDRGVDANDLNFMMELLRLVGSDNPHDAESDSPAEQNRYDQWERSKQLGQVLGRQIVRNTLDDAEGYAVLRIEQDRAGTDYLTGVTNRRGFVRRLHDLYGITDDPVRRGESREALEPVKIAHIYCDANRFSWINNNLGHHIGDAAIIEAAREVQDMFRESDAPIIYRHGGDEFGVILEGLSDEEVDAVIGRIINRQINKATSARYRQAISSVTERIRAIRRAGQQLRVEARQTRLSQEEIDSGQRPHHILYINGEAVTDLRNVITLSLGAKSALVSNLRDIEELRRAAEYAMGGAKRVFHGIIEDAYRASEQDDAGNTT